MAQKKPNIKWGDDIADVIKMVTKAVRSSQDKKRAQGVRVGKRIVKQLDAQGKKKQGGALARNLDKALKEPRMRGPLPKGGSIQKNVPTTGSGRMLGQPQRPVRGNVSGARRSLAKTDADKRAAEKQGSRLLRINTEPQARPGQKGIKNPGQKARGSVVSTSKRSKSQPMGRSSDYEADPLRREIAADRRQMGYQPLPKATRQARSEANKAKRHDDWMKKLDRDIEKAPTKYRRDAAKKAKADYMKKHNLKAKAKPKKGRGGPSKSK